MKIRHWIKLFLLIPSFLIIVIFIFNYIIDPYSMTSYNLLNIPNKFARDDRVEKVAKLKTSQRFDNIILGSSRVYSSNPLMVSKYLGGTTFNAGVGTATVEDHLGFLLLLQRLDKLPKNLIIGLDFYSFNEELETNKYFLKNSDLNFLSNNSPQSVGYLSNFLSIDALRASYKTVINYIKDSKAKPRFDENGASQNASQVFTYLPESNLTNTPYPLETIRNELQFIRTLTYANISKKRLEYLQRIINICKEENIQL